MKRLYFRSIIYNILSYGLTAALCVICLPGLLLPRRFFMGIVLLYLHVNTFLERFILGLRYEVRGAENLPEDGSYIVAAKHQSAYETLKLHLLFPDPAVILKRELLRIPLWGWFLKKSDVIAIDRTSRESAIASINAGAARMAKQGRPIIIFPQGTRVSPDVGIDEMPYKIGVARIQEATGLQILPVAINAGVFWPRNGFFKSGGTVVFEFLKPIKAGMERRALMEKLEKDIEARSDALKQEALEKNRAKDKKKSPWKTFGVVVFAALLFGGYSAYWFKIAEIVKREYVATLNDITNSNQVYAPPVVTGFPGKILVFSPKETVQTEEGLLEVENLRAESWPFPYMPVEIRTDALSFQESGWGEALKFDSLQARLTVKGGVLEFHDSLLTGDDFSGAVTGSIDLAQEPIPKFDIVVTLTNHRTLLDKLIALDVIEDRIGQFLGAGMEAMKDPETGILSLPIHQKDQMLMAGPLPVMRLPIVQKAPKRNRIMVPEAAAALPSP